MSVKSLIENIKLTVIPFIGMLVVWFLYLSNRKVLKLHSLPDEPVIVVFWHEHILMQPLLWRKLRKKQPWARFFSLSSDHKDAEYTIRITRYFGLDAVRGSSRRGGAKALLGSIRKMDQGWDLAITPDGPKGPRHSMADGVVAIAQKRQCKIVATRYIPSRYWRLRSWDRFIIPKPFGTMLFESSEPFDVNGLEMDAAKELIRQKLGIPQD
ncbi:MAG: lysophospholipid acyltransferase family protein [Campylobacterales bacterium]